MKKKYFSILALTAILISSTFFGRPTIASANGFKQGDQYMPGPYDLQAESPTPYNWTRNSPFYSVESNPTLKWELNFKDVVRGNPTIGSDGTIYVPSHNSSNFSHEGYVNAVNNDGTLKWQAFKKGGTDWVMGVSAVIGEDGTLFTGSQAFNPDGTLKWIYGKDHIFQKTPALDVNGNVYYSQLNKVIKLDSNGNLIWSYDVSTSYTKFALSAPSIGTDGTIYIAIGSSQSVIKPGMIAFNPDGSVKWRLEVDKSAVVNLGTYGGYGSIAIGKDGTLYFMITSDTFYAVNPDGTVKWSYKTPEEMIGGPTIGIDGSIIFGARDRSIYALNEDGTLNWNYRTSTFAPLAAPIVDKNGNIYYQVGNYVEALTSSGKLLWRFNLGGTTNSAALSIGKDGTIYAVSGSKLTAITGDIKKEIDFCEVYSNLKGLTEEDLNSQESIDKAKKDLDLLKASLDEIENKIRQAESSQP